MSRSPSGSRLLIDSLPALHRGSSHPCGVSTRSECRCPARPALSAALKRPDETPYSSRDRAAAPDLLPRRRDVCAWPSAKFLGEPYEQSFGATDVAEPIRLLVPHDFTDQFRAMFAQPGERFVDVVHGEHHA